MHRLRFSAWIKPLAFLLPTASIACSSSIPGGLGIDAAPSGVDPIDAAPDEDATFWTDAAAPDGAPHDAAHVPPSSCAIVGDRCGAGAPCCGATECLDGVCQCEPQGAACIDTNDCCTGLTCQAGRC